MGQDMALPVSQIFWVSRCEKGMGLMRKIALYFCINCFTDHFKYDYQNWVILYLYSQTWVIHHGSKIALKTLLVYWKTFPFQNILWNLPFLWRRRSLKSDPSGIVSGNTHGEQNHINSTFPPQHIPTFQIELIYYLVSLQILKSAFHLI